MIQMKNTDKKIAIIRNRKRQSEQVYQDLKQKLKQNGFILTPKNPDIVISVGGDGMLLSAFHMYEEQLDRVRFVGVHTGHLGFYTDYRDFELDKLVENLKLDTGAQVSYPILNVKITFENGDTRIIRALNEATIKRSDRTMVADVIINRVHFERFRGDVIVPKKDKIELVPTRSDYHTIAVDNQTFSFKNIVRIEYQIDNHKIHFVASPSHTSFWNRVRDSFIGECKE